MSRAHRLILLGLLVAGPAQAAPAAGLPEGFGLPRPTGKVEGYLFAHVTGTRKSMVDRATIEAMCKARRQLDPGTATPLFEAGWDKPDTVDTLQYTSRRARIAFTTMQVYGCSNFAALSPANKVCGCTYRSREVRTTQYRRQMGTQVEDVSINHEERKVRRMLLPATPATLPAADGAALAARLAPAVGGTETIVGLDCTVRRQDLGGGNLLEWCITPDDAKAIPDERLRGRTLRHRKQAAGGVEVAAERTVELKLDIPLDEAGFALPEGYAVTR